MAIEILIIQTDNIRFELLIKELSDLYSVKVVKDSEVCESCLSEAKLVVTPDYDIIEPYGARNVLLDSGYRYQTVKDIQLFLGVSKISEDMQAMCKYFK